MKYALIALTAMMVLTIATLAITWPGFAEGFVSGFLAGL